MYAVYVNEMLVDAFYTLLGAVKLLNTLEVAPGARAYVRRL